MRTVLFATAVIAGIIWMSTTGANATPPSMSGIGDTGIQVAKSERIGYRRRYYRRYGYPVPYTYYPPPYGYYLPPSAYEVCFLSLAHTTGYTDGSPPQGDHAEVPPEGDYADAPPPDDGDYADTPPPEGY